MKDGSLHLEDRLTGQSIAVWAKGIMILFCLSPFIVSSAFIRQNEVALLIDRFIYKYGF